MQWLSPKRAAAELERTDAPSSERTLYRWCREGRALAKLLPGGRWLIAVDDDGYPVPAPAGTTPPDRPSGPGSDERPPGRGKPALRALRGRGGGSRALAA